MIRRAALLTVVLLLPTLAAAHPPRAGNPAYIHACVNAAGAVRIVGAPKTVTCAEGETAQHWVKNLPEPEVPEPPAFGTSLPWSVYGGPDGWPYGLYPPSTSDPARYRCEQPELPADFPGEDPGLTVTLETHGRPVVMAFTIGFSFFTTATPVRAFFYPLIDGRRTGYEYAAITLPAASLGQEQLSFHRVLPNVPAGIHRFAVSFDPCAPWAGWLWARWLDVYELR